MIRRSPFLVLAMTCWLIPSTPAAAREVELAVLPPGCLEPWQRVLILATTLAEPVAKQGGQVSIVASGPDGLAGPGLVLFPDAPPESAPVPITSVPNQLEEGVAVDVLETPFERIVVMEPATGLDPLALIEEAARKSGGRFPDVERKRLILHRGLGVAALETLDAAVPEIGDGGTRREIVARFDVSVGDQRASVVAISRSLGGPMRMHRALAEAPADLVLHAGGLRGEACGEAVKKLGVAAVVPRTADLMKPLPGMPYLAANVLDSTGRPAFSRSKIVEVEGVRVALVGLVGLGELARAPVEVRSRLRARSGRDAVADVIAELRRAPEGAPDAVVVLSSGDGSERAQLVGVDGIDVVVADFSRDDGLVVSGELAPGSARERSRHNALASPVFHRAGLGRISLSFLDTATDARPQLGSLRVQIDPLLDDGGYDAAAASFAAPLRREEDERATSGSSRLLPPARVLAERDAARSLVWGERIALLGEVRRRTPSDPPLWTDDLWLRVVGNQVLGEAKCDVALIRNMRRATLVAGPLSRGLVESWLSDVDELAVLELSGAELLRVAERLVALPATVDDASGLIASAGLDPLRKLVAGRLIEPLASYRVAVDNRLLGDPRLSGLLETQRTRTTLSLRDLVVEGLSGHSTPTSEAAAVIEELVVDRAQQRRSEWRIGVQTLELRGSAVRTSPGLLSLAPSLETRALQRDLLLASARIQAFALLDGNGFAWDNQARLQYDATFFSGGGPGPPVIEPFDDVVLTTELRVDALQVQLATDALTLTPFVNVTADGELTPAPTLRRQAQLREAAGLMLTTGRALREVRLGAVVQQDASGAVDAAKGDGRIYNDAGMAGLVRLSTQIAGPLALESTSDARFFFPDGDDRPFDLALRAQSVTRLVAPLSPSTSGFLFVDVVALSPKPSPQSLEWNVVMGGGVAFGGIWRL